MASRFLLQISSFLKQFTLKRLLNSSNTLPINRNFTSNATNSSSTSSTSSIPSSSTPGVNSASSSSQSLNSLVNKTINWTMGLGFITTGLIGTTSYLCLYTNLITEDDLKLNILSLPTHTIRFYRTFIAGALSVIDYKWSLRNYTFGTDEYRQVRSKVHLRTAHRLLRLSQKNRAGFVKAAQLISSMTPLLPNEFTSTLSVMQDKAPFTDFIQIEKSFYKEMGESPKVLYRQFDETPIAAASIAQVHRAFLHDGQEVAVKVQYPDVAEKFLGDIRSIDTVFQMVSWFFPSYKLGWIVKEFKKNIKQELDFTQEAKNSEMLQNNFNKTSPELARFLKVPKVFWSHTTKSILTMEFVRGVKITEMKKLKKKGLNPTQVSNLFIKMFSEQIFVHGFFHGDPHGGNILVSKVNNRPQIIFLDHGIYQVLDEEFRSDFCHLWKAMFLRKTNEIESYGRKLGAGDRFGLLTIILLLRPNTNTWSNVGVRKRLSKKDFTHIKNEIKTISNFTELFESMDDKLLLLLKTSNLLRLTNKELGGQVNHILVMAQYSVKGLHFKDRTLKDGFAESWKLTIDQIVFEFQIILYSTISIIVNWWHGDA